MRTTVSLQALTDRVRGIVPPIHRVRAAGPNRGERALAIALVAVSGIGALLSLGLWIGGHGTAGLRVFCGTILLLLCALRLR